MTKMMRPGEQVLRLHELPRNQRRVELRKAAEARSSGEWGPWEVLELEKGTISNDTRSWTYDITKAHKNRVFAILQRDLPEFGVTHLAVNSLSGIRPTWHEMQRIKNEIAGVGATAVEVYPPNGEVVDGANTFHLWVLPEPLPFGLTMARP